MSFSDLISLKSHILWCRENMEDTVDEIDEREIYREDFRVKINAIEMEIHNKKDKIKFTNQIVQNKIISNNSKDVRVKKAKTLIKNALNLLNEAEEDRVEFNNNVANFKTNNAKKLIENAFLILQSKN